MGPLVYCETRVFYIIGKIIAKPKAYIFSVIKKGETMYNRPMINMEKTGKNILRLRQECNLSVSQLQRMLGLTSPQSIYKWQRGEALPNVDNLVVLAEIFGVSMEDILCYSNSMGNGNMK